MAPAGRVAPVDPRRRLPHHLGRHPGHRRPAGRRPAARARRAGRRARRPATSSSGAPASSPTAATWRWPGPRSQRVNAGEPYDAELGLLTDTLDEAGLGVEAIGNADGTDTVGTSYERQVGLAAATGDGVIPAGELDADLLVRDPQPAFGQRLDLDQVVQRFQDGVGGAGRPGRRARGRRGLRPGPVDALPRPGRQRPLRRAAGPGAAPTPTTCVARLLAEVDPERDAVLLLAPYNLPGDRDLTVSALPRAGPAAPATCARRRRSGPASSPWSTSPPRCSTLLGVDPPGRDGGPPGRGGAPPATSLDDRVDRLVALNEASRFREQLLFPTTLAVVVVLGLICAAAMVRAGPRATRRGCRASWRSPRSPTWRCCRCRSSPGRFPLEDLGAGFYWAFVSVGAAGRRRGRSRGLARRLGRPRLALVAVLRSCWRCRWPT